MERFVARHTEKGYIWHTDYASSLVDKEFTNNLQDAKLYKTRGSVMASLKSFCRGPRNQIQDFEIIPVYLSLEKPN